MAQPALVFTYYIAAPIEKVWDGFVSKEANKTIFMGADLEIELRPGGPLNWSGPGPDGKPMRYVTGEIVRAEAPKLLEYKFGMGDGSGGMSNVKIELTPESEAVKVVLTNDGFGDDASYAHNAEGWPRILSRLKTLLETGKTFKPH